MELLSYEEVAALLRCSVKTVRNKRAAGLWPQGKVWIKPPGSVVRFIRSGLEEWLKTEGGALVKAEAVPVGKRSKNGQ